MSEHTPGPWHADVDSDHGDYVIWTERGKFLANVGTGEEAGEDRAECLAFDVAKANARLIAAAPELLEALEAVVADREYQKLSGAPHFTSAPTEGEWKADSAKKAWAKAAAALAKARQEGA